MYQVDKVSLKIVKENLMCLLGVNAGEGLKAYTCLRSIFDSLDDLEMELDNAQEEIDNLENYISNHKS